MTAFFERKAAWLCDFLRLCIMLYIQNSGDDSYNSLSVSIENRDYHEAFKAAHTLKGVSLNLSLSRLSASASEITEYLRDCDNKIIDETVLFRLFDSVSKDYRMTVEVIEKL